MKTATWNTLVVAAVVPMNMWSDFERGRPVRRKAVFDACAASAAPAGRVTRSGHEAAEGRKALNLLSVTAAPPSPSRAPVFQA